jgi:choline-sulfatase
MADRPNIIWIYCDELRTDALECYGNRWGTMHTPNVDRIAARGVLFENNFVNSPVCVSSRTSTLTARYPEETGVYNNEGVRPDYRLGQRFETFPQIFARHGYHTANFGKEHVPADLKPWMTSSEEGAHMNTFFEEVPREMLDVIHVPAFPYIVIGGRYPAEQPYPADVVTTNALRWLEAAPEPYFLRVSYLQPHTPVLPPPPYDSLYAHLPFPDVLGSSEHSSRFEQRYRDILQSDLLTPAQIRRIHVEYYGLAAWLDAQIGLLLNWLEKHDQLHNTILWFEADHGTSLGEGGRLQKLTFAPEVQRVPRIVSWPGNLPMGQRRSDLCEGLDIGRTLLGLAGLAAEPGMRGRDVFAEPAPQAVMATVGYGFASSRTFPSSARGALDDVTGWPRRTCLRTQRYRLEKNVRINGAEPPPDQEDVFLADTLIDPDETLNRASDPAYQPIRSALMPHLDAHARTHYTPPEAYTQGLETLR